MLGVCVWCEGGVSDDKFILNPDVNTMQLLINSQ